MKSPYQKQAEDASQYSTDIILSKFINSYWNIDKLPHLSNREKQQVELADYEYQACVAYINGG